MMMHSDIWSKPDKNMCPAKGLLNSLFGILNNWLVDARV